jgi:Spy/CpxP family protein refolding chaperone
MSFLRIRSRRAIRGASLTLLALSAAIAGTALAQSQVPTPSATAIADHGSHHGAGGWLAGERALDAVGATDDQKTRIAAIMKQAGADLQPQHTQARALRAQMTQLMAAAAVDVNAIDVVRRQLLDVEAAVSQRRMQAMLDAGAVLTADQRARLAAMLAERQGRQRSRAGGRG